MKSSFTGLTDPGLVRAVNQDAYYIDAEGRFFILADGMGGHAGGQEASSIATKEIRAYLEENWDKDQPSDVLLKDCLKKANEKILDDQYSHPERQDMGTTVVVLLFRQQESWSAHIGDSRLYCFRAGELKQLTDDHTWVARAMRAGEITKEDAKHHPWRHVLSQCLGRKEIYQLDIQKIDVEPGDRLLLCSDGLTEEVPDDLIAASLKEHTDGETLAKDLIEKAKKAGGADNITVIIVESA